MPTGPSPPASSQQSHARLPRIQSESLGRKGGATTPSTAPAVGPTPAGKANGGGPPGPARGLYVWAPAAPTAATVVTTATRQALFRFMPSSPSRGHAAPPPTGHGRHAARTHGSPFS